MSLKITVRLRTVDRFSKSRTFKTLAGAQRFAQRYVGETPCISDQWQYAVGGFGDAKIMVDGDATLYDLFPKVTRDVDA